MTIRKGEEWGTRIKTPFEIRRLASDAELALLDPLEFGSLLSGDICLALGSPKPVQDEEECTLLSIDAMQVSVLSQDGTHKTLLASSRIEVGTFIPKRFGKWRYVCVTNGGIVDRRNLAPRAHPNDGKLDFISINASMPLRERLRARKRAALGTHIPHPEIAVRQGSHFTLQNLSSRETLFIEGKRFRDWEEVNVTILPDYWQIVV